MSKKCNHDCFNCPFDDCINDVLTSKERKEIAERDKNYIDYGFMVFQRPSKSRLKHIKR